MSTSMTLTGQEARIQLRYFLPTHPQNELYEQLCVEYKKQSAEQLQKHMDQLDKVSKVRARE